MEGGLDAVLLVNGELYWRCVYCLVSYKYSGGTRSIAAHRTKAHNKRDTKVKQHEVVKGRIEAAFVLREYGHSLPIADGHPKILFVFCLCSCMEATMHGTLFDSLHFFI